MKLKEQQMKIHTHKNHPHKNPMHTLHPFSDTVKKPHVSVSHIRFFKTEQKPNSAPSFQLLCNVQGKSAGHKPTDVKAFNRSAVEIHFLSLFFLKSKLDKAKSNDYLA